MRTGMATIGKGPTRRQSPPYLAATFSQAARCSSLSRHDLYMESRMLATDMVSQFTPLADADPLATGTDFACFDSFANARTCF